MVTKYTIRRSFLVFLLSLLIIGIESCSLFKTQAVRIHSSKSKKEQNFEKKQIDYRFLLYNGLRQKMLGNYQLAEQYFSKCIETFPLRATPYYELAQLSYQQKKYSEALHYAEKAHHLAPKNKWMHELVIRLYEGYNQLAKTEKELEIIIKNNPSNIPYYFELANVYTLRQKYNDALKIYDKIETMQGVNEETSIKKEEIYIQRKEYDKAIAEINKLIRYYPDNWAYYGLLGDIYTLQNQYDKALKSYRTVLANDSSIAKTYLSMAQMYLQKKDTANSFAAIDSAFCSLSVDLERKLSITYSYMRFYEGRTEYQHYLEQMIQDLVKTYPKNPKVHILQADYLMRHKKYKEAREALRLAKEDKQNVYAYWQQLIYLDAQLNDNKSMYADAKDAIDLFPNIAELYWYGGLGAYFTNRYRETVNLLNKGLELPKDSSILIRITDYYMYLGEAYYHLKDKDSAYYYFDLALQDDSTNYMLMNNYSYYLALDSTNLDKALMMSKKVILKNPKNATYLDTYAWVLYKHGDYQEALKYIKQAMANSEKQGVAFLEHYGDILYRLGRHEEALQEWKNARAIGKGSPYLDLKIKNGKLIEK